jgi:predicted metal-binding membrane protein
MIAGQPSERRFVAASAMLFVVCATLTAVLCTHMSGMDDMPMPGGWMMSMMWMRMPGQAWSDATVSFLVRWNVMMAAMMLPSLAPMLWHYRRAMGVANGTRRDLLTVLTGAGYFFSWNMFGLLIFPLGVTLAGVMLQWPELARFVPMTEGVVVAMAGAIQLTRWKARHLARCREAWLHSRMLPSTPDAAWRQGIRLGGHCCISCANLTAMLLIVGMMDLLAMTIVTAAITAERLAPSGERVAQAIGMVAIGTGLFLSAR